MNCNTCGSTLNLMLIDNVEVICEDCLDQECEDMQTGFENSLENTQYDSYEGDEQAESADFFHDWADQYAHVHAYNMNVLTSEQGSAMLIDYST